ncbi:MAG: preprotein translocase subunit SecE [Bacteroidota bacterium]|jgi:preprotein translocase subunit SecE
MFRKIGNYIVEAYDELKNKVAWPPWKELQGSAIIVSIASLIIGFVVFIMDFAFENILTQFYKLF